MVSFSVTVLHINTAKRSAYTVKNPLIAKKTRLMSNAQDPPARAPIPPEQYTHPPLPSPFPSLPFPFPYPFLPLPLPLLFPSLPLEVGPLKSS